MKNYPIKQPENPIISLVNLVEIDENSGYKIQDEGKATSIINEFLFLAEKNILTRALTKDEIHLFKHFIDFLYSDRTFFAQEYKSDSHPEVEK